MHVGPWSARAEQPALCGLARLLGFGVGSPTGPGPRRPGARRPQPAAM